MRRAPVSALGQRVRSQRRAVIAAGLAAALLATIAASAGAHSFEQPDRVLVGTTGHDSERVTTLDIGTTQGQGATVVMSLPLDRFGLTFGDRLDANSEVQVTTDCQLEAPRCVGEPYTYNPTVESQLILAPDPAVTGGEGTTPVSSQSSRTCTHTQHHCVLVFPGSPIDVSSAAPPACLASACHLNLVLSAYSASAKPGDKLIVGEDEPDGTTVQDKGRVNGIRLRPVVSGPEPAGAVTTSFSGRRVSSVPIRDKLADGKSVVFSQRLDKLSKHEQLSVAANMTTDISHLRNNDRILVNSRLILASRSDATNPSDLVKRVAEYNGEIADANGFNCTHLDTPCLTQKVGVAHLLEDARSASGSRVPLYVNVVVGSTAAGGRVPEGAKLKVTGGTLKVVRYPASRYG
jgi:hypothetical protein